MTELTKADSVRTLKDALAPNTATVNSVADTSEQLKTLSNDKDDTMFNHNTAFGAATDKSSTQCGGLKESTNKTDEWTLVTGKKCNKQNIRISNNLSKNNIVTLHNAFSILSLSNGPT